MAWNNPPLTVYHGTCEFDAVAIVKPQAGRAHSVNLGFSRTYLDFGPGFYVTTSLKQARSWANLRAMRKGAKQKAGSAAAAAVIRFSLERNALAALRDLVFVSEATNDDYWTFVTHCRTGELPLHGLASPYDIVYGPVCAWPQRILYKDCDQIGLHTDSAITHLERAEIIDCGEPLLKG